MDNFRDFLSIGFYTKTPEKIFKCFFQKVKTQGTEKTFGKFQSIWTLTSAGPWRYKEQERQLISFY